MGKTIGFVPTMGALHAGHLALVERARNENDIVVCSIYVNPLQFNNTSDLNLYPRVLESDCTMLEAAGCDMVFTPDDTIISDSAGFEYEVGYLDTVMEGAFRPGHFKGVAYIVKKLFEIVAPHRAYFGEKDYQQLAVVRQMNSYFKLGVNIVPCLTVREPDGLAMSSRNTRLNHNERQIAPAIYKALLYIKENISHFPVTGLKNKFEEILFSHGLFSVEYIEICNAETLEILSNTTQCKNIVVCTAVNLGNVRLIDNIKINL